MPVSGTPVTDALERSADLSTQCEELEMEYASLDEAFGELEAQNSKLIVERNTISDEYGRLLEQLKWTHGVLSILIEEQGGVVQISKKVMEEYDPYTQLRAYEDVQGETFIIEVVAEEDE